MNAKKIIVPIAIVAGIAIIIGGVIALGSSASRVAYADVIKIQQKALEDKISVNGTLESSERRNVYAKLNYPVETVNVSVGDIVKKGDILCTISTDELQQQILQQQASVDSSGVSSDYNLSEAEQRYAEALAEFESGENSLIMNAAKAVEQAEKNLEDVRRQQSDGTGTTIPMNLQNAKTSMENARLTYENSVKAYEDAENALKPENYPTDVKTIYNNLNEARRCLEIVQNNNYIKELEDAKKRFEEAEKNYTEAIMIPGMYPDSYIQTVTTEYTNASANYEAVKNKYNEVTLKEQIKSLEPQLEAALDTLERTRDNAKTSMENAKLAYDNAVANYESTQKQSDSSTESYDIAVKNAEEALETAKNEYDIAVRQAEANLASLKKAAEQQRTISGLNDPQVIILQNLKDKLEYAIVTAPCDGVVTAVNAEEGAVAAGALFTIENIGTLEISASVGEYDIPYVKEGMDAVIRCDALGNEEFSGKIIEVAKTPINDPYSSQSGTNYRIKVSINNDDERLLVGMNAKITIITEKKDGALTITYDALTTDDKGNDAIYIAEKGDDGTYRAKLVTVNVGMETDYEIEVVSSELKEGMFVLTNTTMIMDGSVVMVDDSEGQE